MNKFDLRQGIKSKPKRENISGANYESSDLGGNVVSCKIALKTFVHRTRCF